MKHKVVLFATLLVILLPSCRKEFDYPTLLTLAHYSKTYTSPAQLTALLQSRGLHVENVKQ